MEYGKANRALEAVALKEGVPVQEVIKRIEEAMEAAVLIAKESNDRQRLAFWEELRSRSDDSPAAALIDCLTRRILNEKKWRWALLRQEQAGTVVRVAIYNLKCKMLQLFCKIDTPFLDISVI